MGQNSSPNNIDDAGLNPASHNTTIDTSLNSVVSSVPRVTRSKTFTASSSSIVPMTSALRAAMPPTPFHPSKSSAITPQTSQRHYPSNSQKPFSSSKFPHSEISAHLDVQATLDRTLTSAELEEYTPKPNSTRVDNECCLSESVFIESEDDDDDDDDGNKAIPKQELKRTKKLQTTIVVAASAEPSAPMGKNKRMSIRTSKIRKATSIQHSDDDSSDDSGPYDESHRVNKNKYSIETNLPPIHDISEIFKDMTEKALKIGLRGTMHHLGSRKLRVGTMCSGTESPILALDLIHENLKQHFGIDFQIEHIFSAEIVPFKQAYIERNFHPPIIFRDIRELRDHDEASTAYGSTVRIPGDIELLVAGFSCVDFSGLNTVKKQLDHSGESGDTFRAILGYARRWRPPLIVLENIANAPWTEIKEYWQSDANYSAKMVKLDTKQYYIPHTRQRGYMLCIDNELTRDADEKVQEWATLMTKLSRPASSSIDEFLLHEDDPRIHRAREELAKGLRGAEKTPREVDWVRCQGRHQDYRAEMFLGHKRPMTNWEESGSCKMPDYAWGDWGIVQVERIWDTLDMSLLRNAARGFDSQYKTHIRRVWELSQNIDRALDSTQPGITGCITPSGIPYISNRGGPLIGLEALSMQGLPIEKLLLTRESQKQLQDLAGNAMTSTVVGAAMLAALIVGHDLLKEGPRDAMQTDKKERKPNDLRGEHELKENPLNLNVFAHKSVDSVLAEARNSLRLCLCEGRVLITSRKILCCSKCGHTACAKCAGTPTHEYHPVEQDILKSRKSPAVFENYLKEAIPMKMRVERIKGTWLEELKVELDAEGNRDWDLLRPAIELATRSELCFKSIRRSQIWTVNYEAQAARMELILTPSLAEWRFYAKPDRKVAGNAPIRQVLAQPFARMRPNGSNLVEGNWEICLPMGRDFSITIQGKGELVPSWESTLGLQHSHFAKKLVWSKLDIKEQSTTGHKAGVSGVYELLPDCGTASGSLHKRISKDDTNSLFCFLDPERIGSPGRDQFVFSVDIRRLINGEIRPILARVNSSWRPSAHQGLIPTNCATNGQWIDWPGIEIQPVVLTKDSIFGVAPPNMSTDVLHTSCNVTHIMLLCKARSSEVGNVNMEENCWIDLDGTGERSLCASFAWLIERARRLSGFDQWRSVNMSIHPPQCSQCAPVRPSVRWRMSLRKTKQEPKQEPYEDPQESGQYEQALKRRAYPFITQIRYDSGEDGDVIQLKIGFNPYTLIHRALANLPNYGNLNYLTVSWRLTPNYIIPPKPKARIFRLLSNKFDIPCTQPPNFTKHDLRLEQLRSLSWMRSQEADNGRTFVIDEIEEALLPHLGWRAEGRATKTISVRGGVLADQVGFGKTATTLGLIDANPPKNRATDYLLHNGKILSSATLIVVPQSLISQWNNEIEKFLYPAYKNHQVLVIRTQQMLNKYRIKDFQNAKIIIVSWPMLNNDTYLSRLGFFAAVPEAPASAGRAFDAWYAYALQRMASHVDTLVHAGAQALEKILQEVVHSAEESKYTCNIFPSKRFRGKAYQADRMKKAARSIKASSSDLSLEIEPFSESNAETGSKRKALELDVADDEPIFQEPKPKSEIGLTFALGSAAARKDWKDVKSPLFQMFHFDRLVIDEYTYIGGIDYTCVTSLRANARWVLSGTPPLEDFADIKTISTFIGVHLGIDDDAVGILKPNNIKTLQKDRTSVEEFQSFRQIRSPAWHEHRDEVAQRFLDQFARQNVAEIVDIPFEEHLVGVMLPAAERALYLELQQQLMSQDMKIRTGAKAILNCDRARRMKEIIGSSTTPEEALLKRCSHFLSDSDLAEDYKNASEACTLIVAKRKEQHENLLQELRGKLKHALSLYRQCSGKHSHFDTWKRNVFENEFGDIEAMAALKSIYEDIKDHKFSDETARTNGNLTPGDPQSVKQLRDLKNDLDKLSLELVNRERSLRFMGVIQSIQSESSVCCNASICKARATAETSALSVMGLCGHIACKSCLEDSRRGDDCVVQGCKAAAKKFRIEPLAAFRDEHSQIRTGRHYGEKLQEIVRLINKISRNEDPNDPDQIILFVQYEDLMAKVLEALEKNNIRCTAILSGRKINPDKIINDFKENKKQDRAKVLILNIANEFAAGANLTNANHIIFVSPLLTNSQYWYDASNIQAIGRCRRFGQGKLVHIYRFLSLKTIDIDILQQRTRKTLVKINGEFKLMRKADIMDQDVEEYGGGFNKFKGLDDFDDGI
ncbi:MAG: hypothetical protein M1827_004575 [Pycnora praestabilis]|nr:MAG: hypothetical protein M1827_004575 [Pycnora praestabilis]